MTILPPLPISLRHLAGVLAVFTLCSQCPAAEAPWYLTGKAEETVAEAPPAIASSGAVGAVSSRWQPERRQQWDRIVIRSSTQIGMQFCHNLLREFMPEIKRKLKR